MFKYLDWVEDVVAADLPTLQQAMEAPRDNKPWLTFDESGRRSRDNADIRRHYVDLCRIAGEVRPAAIHKRLDIPETTVRRDVVVIMEMEKTFTLAEHRDAVRVDVTKKLDDLYRDAGEIKEMALSPRKRKKSKVYLNRDDDRIDARRKESGSNVVEPDEVVDETYEPDLRAAIAANENQRRIVEDIIELWGADAARRIDHTISALTEDGELGAPIQHEVVVTQRDAVDMKDIAEGKIGGE